MIKFNPENKKELTYQETCAPAMEVTEKEEAKQYLSDYADWLQASDPHMDAKTAIETCQHNIAYFAGYYSNEVRVRVQNLFGAEHPFLGDANNPPTAEEAFRMGLDVFRNSK